MDVCKYCQSSFINKDALKNHLLTEHLEYSRKERFEFYQSLFKMNKSDKAQRKINKKNSKSKGDKKTKPQIKYKFDKRYKGVLYNERVTIVRQSMINIGILKIPTCVTLGKSVSVAN